MKSRIPRDAEYLKFIRSQKCCMCGVKHFIHAHHTTTGGTGLKGSDYETVPLCPTHHNHVHWSGRKDNIPNCKEVIARLNKKYKGDTE